MSAMPSAVRTLWTIGHSTRPWPQFVDMLHAPGDITALNARFRPLTTAELQTVLQGAVAPLQAALALPDDIFKMKKSRLPIARFMAGGGCFFTQFG